MPRQSVTLQIVNGVKYKYIWQGSKLISEAYGGKVLEFFYDESGKPYAFSYKASATATPAMYYYVTNLQGDIISILDSSGASKAEYVYNAWGEIISAAGTMAEINPLRYRGYYYDSETGFYYCKSRYYAPEICRFISADSNFSTGQGATGNNMFVYCLNNPVIYVDSTGSLGELAIFPLLAYLAPIVYTAAVVATAVTVAVAVVYLVYTTADYVSDKIAQAKKNNEGSSATLRVDTGGGTASPTPPGNGNNNRDRKYRGDSTYNKNGVRIDYEYYGNGNVHVHTGQGKFTYDFSAQVFRTEANGIAPRSVQKPVEKSRNCKIDI